MDYKELVCHADAATGPVRLFSFHLPLEGIQRSCGKVPSEVQPVVNLARALSFAD
jgi:hypothetical protein